VGIGNRVICCNWVENLLQSSSSPSSDAALNEQLAMAKTKAANSCLIGSYSLLRYLLAERSNQRLAVLS